MLVLGGGAIGCEIGQVYARFGVQVMLVERGARLLPAEEPEASEVVRSALEGEGLRIHTGSAATRVTREGGLIRLTLEDGVELTADELLVAVGSAPNVAGLGLESAGIDVSGGRIPVDHQLRAADGIWAMGDATGMGLFTHLAMHQAHVVEADVLGQPVPAVDYGSLPSVTFTDPEIGSVGMREADARAAGLDVSVTVKQVPRTFRGWIHGAGNDGLIKLIAERRRGVLVGATYVGPHAGESLGLLGAAVQLHIPLTDLRRLVYAFPTFYGGVGEALGAYARALTQVLDPDTPPLDETRDDRKES